MAGSSYCIPLQDVKKGCDSPWLSGGEDFSSLRDWPLPVWPCFSEYIHCKLDLFWGEGGSGSQGWEWTWEVWEVSVIGVHSVKFPNYQKQILCWKKSLNIICIGRCSITMDKITDKQLKNISILAKCHRIHSVCGWLASLLLSWGVLRREGTRTNCIFRGHISLTSFLN